MKKTLIILFSIIVGAIAWSSLYACGGGMMGGIRHQGTHQGTDVSSHEGGHATTQQHTATGGTHQGSSGMTSAGRHVFEQGIDEGIQAQHVDQQQHAQVLNQDQARALVQDYLRSASDQQLMINQIFESTDYYEAEIVDHDGFLMDRIRVDKQSGTLQSAYISE